MHDLGSGARVAFTTSTVFVWSVFALFVFIDYWYCEGHASMLEVWHECSFTS